MSTLSIVALQRHVSPSQRFGFNQVRFIRYGVEKPKSIPIAELISPVKGPFVVRQNNNIAWSEFR